MLVAGFQRAFDTIAKWHDDIISKCKRFVISKMAIVFLLTQANVKKNSPELAVNILFIVCGCTKKSEDVYISHSDAIL